MRGEGWGALEEFLPCLALIAPDTLIRSLFTELPSLHLCNPQFNVYDFHIFIFRLVFGRPPVTQLCLINEQQCSIGFKIPSRRRVILDPIKHVLGVY